MEATSSLEPRTELLQTTVEKSIADALRTRARMAERSVAAELRRALRFYLADQDGEQAA